MATDILTPGENPGEYFIPALGKTVKLVKWREDNFYDTVYQAAGAIAAGTELVLFRDIQGKNIQHCNLTTSRRINAGSEMVMNRVGVSVNQAIGNVVAVGSDTVKVCWAAACRFSLGRERIIQEGPLVTFPSGYGVVGSTTENNTAYLTSGVASAAAAPQLLVAQPIEDNDDLFSSISFLATTWQAAIVAVTTTVALAFSIYLHGLIKDPQGK